jgi:hypothetical protein
MLKVYIHAGTLDTRNLGNQLAILDIAYAKRHYLADYAVAMTIKGAGEVPPDTVTSYPRWSGSLWDLIARALTRILYRDDTCPPTKAVDRRCAYATKLCIVVERSTLDDQGLVLATGEIVQMEGRRGHYVVNLEEDILGRHSAAFTYGMKSLNPSDLVLRALCWALYGRDTLGKRPVLAIPPTVEIEGKHRFDIEALQEPARTGFNRSRAPLGSATPPDPMPTLDDYSKFLAQG